ncbi:hypothetical protein NBRC116188_15720 [Oceaniserpentilla sp. 4NH20-0058]|uniref:ABC transporter substrate-binding protein n=1 Tax=Oceaniserpentilla sp. 4NH20-0058 TaxID=3127660 RepID=UPI0031080ECD
MVKSLMRRLLLVVLSLTLVQPSLSLAKTSIKVGIDLWPGYYPIIIAKHQGFFSEADLDVSYVLPEETNNLLNMFSEHRIDLLCVAMGDAFALYEKDSDFRVVMITDQSNGGDALLRKGPLPKPGHKVKIGTNLQGFGELFVREFLKRSGYFPQDVVLVQQEASQAMEYLRSGKADIVHTWEPYVSDITKYYGAQVVFDSGETPNLIPDALLANGQFIKHHPEALKKFVSAWFKGVQWWQDNRALGDQIIEQNLLLIPGSLSLKGIKLYSLKDNQIAFSSQSGMKSINFVADKYLDFFKAKQTFSQLPNEASDIITGRFLPRAPMEFTLSKWFITH